MLDIGAIWRLHSPWASAVVLVQKKHGGLKFCINLRKLYNWTVKDAYLLPWINETLDSLQGSQWFSSLNLKSGYWQVKMDQESRPLTRVYSRAIGFLWMSKTAFWAHQCPCNRPEANGDLTWGPQSPLEYHLSGWHSHLLQGSSQSPQETWGCVLEKKGAGLKLKPSKCELFWQQLAYLVHMISTQGAQGVATDEGKIEAIKNWPTPTNVTEVQSFWGFTGYYCRFISKFMQVAWPLHELISGENAGKKKVAIKCYSRCQQAFDDLKKLCTMALILAYANFTKPFKLHTDANGTGLGAVLYQTWEDGTEAYASSSLSKAKSH